MSDKIPPIETIKFNVGGTTYEVSRSLLNQFPDTMIARAASETWNQPSHDKSIPIFIDRNGERFAYLLDYMRDNKIVIPNTIPKQALMGDLKYYGFDNIDSIPITVDTPDSIILQQSLACLQRMADEDKDEMMKKFARDCYREVVHTCSLNVKMKTSGIDFFADRKLFEKHLNTLGLSWTGRSHQMTSNGEHTLVLAYRNT